MPIKATTTIAASFKRKPDLQRDLIPVHLSSIYVAPNLSHLEPAKVPQRARRFGYGVLNSFRDALLGSSDDIHDLIDWIGHFHSPWIGFCRPVAELSSSCLEEAGSAVFRSVMETVLSELLWSAPIVLRDMR